MNKKLKIYLDTSVINFLFSEQSPEKKEITIDFFENYLDRYDVYISDIVVAEVKLTKNPQKKQMLLDVIEKYNLKVYNEINPEILNLAGKYIEAKIIPEKYFDDAQHIAFAVFYEFDILLSWNFKHLANINKQIPVNGLNMLLGYTKQIYLLNPMEVISDD